MLILGLQTSNFACGACNGYVTVRKRFVFVFCGGGPGPSEGAGGRQQTGRSKNVGPATGQPTRKSHLALGEASPTASACVKPPRRPGCARHERARGGATWASPRPSRGSPWPGPGRGPSRRPGGRRHDRGRVARLSRRRDTTWLPRPECVATTSRGSWRLLGGLVAARWRPGGGFAAVW